MTRAKDTHPTRRVLTCRFAGDLVVELRSTLILIRPLRSRRGGPAEVALTVGSVYQRGIMAAIEERRRAKRKGKTRRVSRGGLS